MNILKKRLHSDSGGAMSIFMIAGVFLVLILGMFIIDITKNRYMKNFYDNATQRATTVAVKEQNTVGGLTTKSVKKFIVEYYGLRGTPVFEPSVSSSLSTKESYGTSDSKAFRPLGCDVDTPKIKIKFDTGRGIGSKENLVLEVPPIKQTGYQNLQVRHNGVLKNLNDKSLERLISQGQYKVLSAEVEDTSGNFILGLVGQKCSHFVSVKSANTINTFNAEN